MYAESAEELRNRLYDVFLMLDAVLLLAALNRIPAARLITLGPESSIEEQLQYAKRHWPKDFFVAVLTIESKPECSKHRGSRVTYCRADIAIERMIWNPGQQERRNHYRLHYWYPREEKAHGRLPTLYPKLQSRLVGVLAPTHSNDVLSPDLLLEATPEAIDAISAAIANVER